MNRLRMGRRTSLSSAKREVERIGTRIKNLLNLLLDDDCAQRGEGRGEWCRPHVRCRRPFSLLRICAPRPAGSLLAVRRGSESIASPPTDMRFEDGDVLYLVGEESDMLLARPRLTKEP